MTRRVKRCCTLRIQGRHMTQVWWRHGLTGGLLPGTRPAVLLSGPTAQLLRGGRAESKSFNVKTYFNSKFVRRSIGTNKLARFRFGRPSFPGELGVFNRTIWEATLQANLCRKDRKMFGCFEWRTHSNMVFNFCQFQLPSYPMATQ